MADNIFLGPVQNVAKQIDIVVSPLPCTECGAPLLEKHFARYPYCNKCIGNQQSEAYEARAPKIRWTIIGVVTTLLLLIFIATFILPFMELIEHGAVYFLENAKRNPPIKLLEIPLSLWVVIVITTSSLHMIRYKERELWRKITREIPKHQPL